MTAAPRDPTSNADRAAAARLRQSGRKIVLVVAAARNRVIGRNGTMPWRIPSDLKTFRRETMGRPIIMGRKTFQSIGRALDGRTNIVITRDNGFSAPQVLRAGSLADAFAIAESAPSCDGHVMVIGGGEVYQASLPLAELVLMTEIDGEPVGDTYFPELPADQWQELARTVIEPDPRDDFPATLVTYQRRV